MADDGELTANDPEGVARAAREAMRAQVLQDLKRRGLESSPELQECPRCHERMIHPDVATTYVKDRALGALICAPCGTERSVLHMVLPDNMDIGGEAG